MKAPNWQRSARTDYAYLVMTCNRSFISTSRRLCTASASKEAFSSGASQAHTIGTAPLQYTVMEQGPDKRALCYMHTWRTENV